MGSGERNFSQAQGYEEIPKPLTLEQLPKEARTQIWNLFYVHLRQSEFIGLYRTWIGGVWKDIFQNVHAYFDNLPLDEYDTDFEGFCRNFRRRIESQRFNKVFDLIQFILRHPQCPLQFVEAMRSTFETCRLPYILDFGPPPTIVPATTPEEGAAVVESLQSLREAGLIGSSTHLREASSLLNVRDWAGSARESIHAVESVARQLDPDAASTLGPALKAIERQGALHPALKEAFIKLYGYTCDEQGIRHALLDQRVPKVGQDEAVFMLGACASFASYLARKHVAGAQS